MNYQKRKSTPQHLPAPAFAFRFELEFPTERRFMDGSLLAVLRSAEAAVQAAGGAGGARAPAPVDLERVRVALAEALSNAAEHGNGYRPERRIRVQGRADDSALWIEVEDEGPGFDVEATTRGLAAKDTRRERGRGILFMKGLADELRFERGGSRVVLCFNRKEAA